MMKKHPNCYRNSWGVTVLGFKPRLFYKTKTDTHKVSIRFVGARDGT